MRHRIIILWKSADCLLTYTAKNTSSHRPSRRLHALYTRLYAAYIARHAGMTLSRSWHAITNQVKPALWIEIERERHTYAVKGRPLRNHSAVTIVTVRGVSSQGNRAAILLHWNQKSVFSTRRDRVNDGTREIHNSHREKSKERILKVVSKNCRL